MMTMIKQCSICGVSNSQIIFSKITNTLLCKKHYLQAYRNGFIKTRTQKDKNEIIVINDYAEIIIYDYDSNEIARSLIDAEDVCMVSKYKWGMSSNGYVRNGSVGYLHRLVINCPPNKDVDHMSGDRIDNRKSNLRIVTRSENSLNRHCKTKSGYVGVHQDNVNAKWISTLMINGKSIWLGRHENIKDAIDSRIRAEEIYIPGIKIRNQGGQRE